MGVRFADREFENVLWSGQVWCNLVNLMTQSSPIRVGYGTCPDICDHPDEPGEPCPSKFLDGALKPTTIDQARIEEAIASRGSHGLRILHVGAANSSLARRFAAQAREIIAITLSPNEKNL